MTFDGLEPFFERSAAEGYESVPVIRHGQPTRRAMVVSLAGCALALGFGPSVQAAEKLVPPSPRTQDRWLKVKLAVEIQGELKLQTEGQKPTRTPLEVTSQQVYLERVPAPSSAFQHLASIRNYDQAKADFQVGNANYQSQLDPARQLVAVQVVDGQTTLFSPLSPFTRGELDLLEIPCNTAILPNLLPSKPISPGEEWSASDLTWAQLLGLETVQQNQVKLKLDRWEGVVAMIQAAGTLQGSAGGVSTDIEVKAKLQYDRNLGQITWIALGLAEDRAIGHAEPGFKVNIRVRAALEPVKEPGPLADRLISELPLDVTQAGTLVSFLAERSSLRLLLDRRWRVVANRPNNVVLRYVDQGDLVAQCNLSRLPSLMDGKQLPLEELQEDIRLSLGGSFQQFTEATQNEEDGRRVLRVVAVGVASELPIQWIYHHVSDAEGRRFVAVFTIESELVERFAEADRVMVGGVEISDPDPKPAADPKPKEIAAAPATAAARPSSPTKTSSR